MHWNDYHVARYHEELHRRAKIITDIICFIIITLLVGAVVYAPFILF